MNYEGGVGRTETSQNGRYEIVLNDHGHWMWNGAAVMVRAEDGHGTEWVNATRLRD
jgi:hypothetical protein